MSSMLVLIDTDLAECTGLKITCKTLNKTIFFQFKSVCGCIQFIYFDRPTIGFLGPTNGGLDAKIKFIAILEELIY